MDRDFLALPPAERLAQIDARVASWISDPQALRHTHELAPLPVLGVPGWCAENGRAEYYEDRDHFRPGRVRGRPPSPAAGPAALKEIR